MTAPPELPWKTGTTLRDNTAVRTMVTTIISKIPSRTLSHTIKVRVADAWSITGLQPQKSWTSTRAAIITPETAALWTATSTHMEQSLSSRTQVFSATVEESPMHGAPATKHSQPTHHQQKHSSCAPFELDSARRSSNSPANNEETVLGRHWCPTTVLAPTLPALPCRMLPQVGLCRRQKYTALLLLLHKCGRLTWTHKICLRSTSNMSINKHYGRCGNGG